MTVRALQLGSGAHGVATLALARPETLNAFDETMIAELTDSFERFGADPSVRIVVMVAQGRLFCAGADIGWMQRQSQNSQDANLVDARRFAAMLHAVHECPKPVVVRVHGDAFGGGVGLMAAADIVIAARGTRFAVSEAKFGILPAVIGPYLTQAVGSRQARRLALTTARITADEALELGLVHEVVAPGELDAAVERTIAQLLSSGPDAMAEIKKLYARLHGCQIDAEIRELTAQTIARVRSTAEAQEGFVAFLAKRPANWTQR